MSTQNTPREEVFESNDYLYFYKDMLTPERTEQESQFIIEALKLTPYDSILDIPCGYGRHAGYLTKLGYKMTGVDFSNEFLEIAHQNTPEATFLQADMRKLMIENTFTKGYCLFTSFGYFDEEENLDVLRSFHKALKPNGMFCVELRNKDAFKKHHGDCSLTEKGDDLLVDQITYDEATSHMVTKRITVRNGITKKMTYSFRLYTVQEFSDLARQVGFSIEKIYGGYDNKPLEESNRLIVVLRK